MTPNAEPCGWTEPHEDHTKPGALANRCHGLASEFLSEHTHSAECANRRLTDKVMGSPFRCRCSSESERG